MAVKTELNPALARDGGEDVEAIAVDISIKKFQNVCTTAYGPQEKDLRDKKGYVLAVFGRRGKKSRA